MSTPQIDDEDLTVTATCCAPLNPAVLRRPVDVHAMRYAFCPTRYLRGTLSRHSTDTGIALRHLPSGHGLPLGLSSFRTRAAMREITAPMSEVRSPPLPSLFYDQSDCRHGSKDPRQTTNTSQPSSPTSASPSTWPLSRLP